MGAYPLAVAGPPFTASLIAGGYIQPNLSINTNAGLGTNNLRLIPFYTPSPFHISALGAEFTAAGDAASLFAVGGYADNGSGYPGALITNPGSISTGTGNAGTVATGGTPGVYMVPIATPVLVPAGLSWWGGSVQGVTVTQPTMRTAQFSPFSAVPNAVPGANATATGYLQGSVSGAFPATFQAYSGNIHASCARPVLLVSSVP